VRFWRAAAAILLALACPTGVTIIDGEELALGHQSLQRPLLHQQLTASIDRRRA